MRSKLKLLGTILRHKWYVFVAGFFLRVPMWRLIVHDLSKFGPQEFSRYARQFDGRAMTQPAEFAKAWLHHQNHNDHHWEYWCLRDDHRRAELTTALPMPEAVVREMVADWLAAGKVYAGSWPDLSNFTWYQANRERMSLHPTTQVRLNHVLEEAKQFTWGEANG